MLPARKHRLLSAAGTVWLPVGWLQAASTRTPHHPLACLWACKSAAHLDHPRLLACLQCEPPAPEVTCLTDTSKGCRTCQAAPDQLKCATCVNAAYVINAAGVVSRMTGLYGQNC